ncbi:hypothetical protein NECAME_15059 [Necator americanus]|uniref:Uncharacterized protein n=1 Tax=Necator americanus TaxID=51031 RepID=W2SMA8_NECAM|nr:hypothetical protein NECAME_15059 [Necator americanus]ETN69847.1 hypothetical protein NECAME_15059 [Necator americanus]
MRFTASISNPREPYENKLDVFNYIEPFPLLSPKAPDATKSPELICQGGTDDWILGFAERWCRTLVANAIPDHGRDGIA